MKIHKGDKIEITMIKPHTLLFKLNGYIQHYEPDHEYMLKRCGITWQEAVNTLAFTDCIAITI